MVPFTALARREWRMLGMRYRSATGSDTLFGVRGNVIAQLGAWHVFLADGAFDG